MFLRTYPIAVIGVYHPQRGPSRYPVFGEHYLFTNYAKWGRGRNLEKILLLVISGFRRDVDEICALLGYYAASNRNPLPTFRDFLTLEDGTDTLSRNFGK
jgi:hypothetical protein